jgi:zinc protease
MSEGEEGVSGQGSSRDLETMLQLVHLRLAAPRRDPEAFAAWQAARAESVERRSLSPEIALGDAMTAALSGGHRRRAPITAADVRAVDLDTALAIYRDRLGDTGDWTFTLVGNLELATLKPLVETYLGSLPATARRDARKDIGVKAPRGVVKKVVRRGTEPKAYVHLTFHDRDTWSLDAEHDTQILWAVLETRLREILREDLGGVYGVGVWGYLTRFPIQERVFSIRFGCAPDNVEKLRAAALAEVARIQKEGVAESYLEKVRETRRRSHEQTITTNGFWLGLLSQAALEGDDPHAILSTAVAAERVTNDLVKVAARRFLSTKRYVSLTLLPAP